MKTVKLNRSDLYVSEICLGADRFGTGTNRDDAFRMLDMFRDAGGSFVDTANIYARDSLCSRSEKLLGEYIASRGRNSLIIATKGGHPNISSMHTPRLSKAEIEHDLDESLRVLGLDCIELYWLHRDDLSQPIGDILETLEGFVRTGKIRYYGASNYRADRLTEGNRYAEEHGLSGFCAVSNMWSPARQNEGHPLSSDDTLVRFEDEDLSVFDDTGMTFIPYSSSAKGWFAKRAAGLSAPLDGIYENEHNLALLEKFRQSGKNVQTALLEYMCDYSDAQIIPITSVSRLEQLSDILKVHCG